MRPRPSSRLVLAAVALALLLGPGCFGPSDSPIELTPYLELNDGMPGRGTDFALYLRSTNAFRQELPVTAELPAGWAFAPETPLVDIPGKGESSLIVRITPDINATYGVHRIRVAVGDTRTDLLLDLKPLNTTRLRAGIGTQLHYVGWYGNGTLFGHNTPGVSPTIPLVPPGESDPNEPLDYTPLKVYVGGQRGQDPPEPYNGTGYRPVIAGFDARLQDAGDGRGMIAGETLAVRIPAEEAYTRPGNEDHVLYGEDLNFLIRIVTVDELHARECGLPVCPAPGAVGK